MPVSDTTKKRVSVAIADCSINFIPCEILTRIFTFLELSDRKNVRRTCRLWYDCATSLSVTRNEKFVFRSGFSIQEIAKILLNPSFLQMSLEFQGLHIDSLPVYTWKACGRRVQSLEFHDCRWSDKTIKNIILHCVELVTFRVETSFCVADHNLGNIFCSPRLLNDLVDKGIKRTKLRTFTLFVDDVHLPSSVLSKIFLIYPNIKHFHTGTYSCEDSSFYCLVLHLGKEPVFSRLDKCLNKHIKLESLTFNIPTDGRWFKSFIPEPESDQIVSKLTKFETMIIYSPLTKKYLLDFFKVQNDLQVVRLALAECNEEFVKELMFHVLENCPKLREFRYKFEPYYLSFTPTEMPRFLALISKLQCLTLSFNISEMSISKTLPTLALTALRLEHYEMNEEFCIILLKQCSSLRHLELTHLSDNLLQKIFEYLPNLETLVLNHIDTCTNDGFIGQDGGFSIKRLRKLKHLELNGYCSVEVTEKFIQELELPCLETLNLAVGLYRSLSLETLNRLAKNLPALKSLAIDEIDEPGSVEKTTEFCKNLKNLYRLYCFESYLDDLHHSDEELMRNIFEACPSLRYISDSEFYMFLYNPFTKKVMRKTLENFKFRGNIFGGDISGAQNNHVYFI